MVTKKSKDGTRHTNVDRLFLTANNLFLLLWLIIVLYPLLYVVNASVSDPIAILEGGVRLWPVGFNLEGYRAVFQSNQIWVGYANSLFYTIVATGINVVLTVMVAYPLSRRDVRGRGLVSGFLVFTMLFNGGLIPMYLLIRDLGMLNTRWALLLPHAVSVWNVIITRTYFQSAIPAELLESAQMDGCSNTRFVIQIVLPLSRAILAVIALFYAVFHWNAYFDALIYLRDQSLFPLQIVLRSILLMSEVDTSMVADADRAQALEFLSEMLKYSLIVVASAPVIIAYPFVQKHFVKGVMVGSLKG